MSKYLDYHQIFAMKTFLRGNLALNLSLIDGDKLCFIKSFKHDKTLTKKNILQLMEHVRCRQNVLFFAYVMNFRKKTVISNLIFAIKLSRCYAIPSRTLTNDS
jgi:hypothetical protein